MSSEPTKEQATTASLIVKSVSRLKRELKIFLEPANLERLRPTLGYQTAVLAIFALLASILLGFADLATRDVIQLPD